MLDDSELALRNFCAAIDGIAAEIKAALELDVSERKEGHLECLHLRMDELLAVRSQAARIMVVSREAGYA